MAFSHSRNFSHNRNTTFPTPAGAEIAQLSPFKPFSLP
jgi:hypothetical protein